MTEKKDKVTQQKNAGKSHNSTSTSGKQSVESRRSPEVSERSQKMSTDEKTKPFIDMFEQTGKNYEEILKSGLKVQQESTKWWTDTISGATSTDVQKKVKAMADDLIPQTQKNIADCMKVIEVNGRTGIELVKKAFAVSQAGLASMSSICETTQAFADVNTKGMESWLEFIRKSGETAKNACANAKA